MLKILSVTLLPFYMKYFLLIPFTVLLFSCEKDKAPEPVSKSIPAEKPKVEMVEETVDNQEEIGKLSFLALGDSYTIGEGVSPKNRWPDLLVEQLKASGTEIEKFETVARSGWTTADLKLAIGTRTFDTKYDLVSLLIGVNNQYQGKSIELYQVEFKELLNIAIKLAGGAKENVFVLSIPDYSVTPFADGRNKSKIAEEIRMFNAANKEICDQLEVCYFDITPISQQANNNPDLLTGDNLHPSGKMYAQWVELILPKVLLMVKE